MDIFSKRSEPRREDVAARKLIKDNQQTIRRLADQFSNGAFSAAQNARSTSASAPKPSGLIISDLGSGRKSETPAPYIRISPNRRVVVVDGNTSRQMHHLGEIRRIDGKNTFVMATSENGFFSALDTELAELIAPLDGAVLGPDLDEATLSEKFADLLGI